MDDRLAGLDPEEVASIPAGELDDPKALAGRFRITRRPLDVLPFVLGLALVPAIWGLGAEAVAGVLAAVVVVGWVVRSRRRVAVFDIDHAGAVSFRRHGTLDWSAVEAISYRLDFPFGTPTRRRAGSVPVALVRIDRRGRRPLRLAKGQLFRTRPSRQHVPLHRLSDHLRRAARAAGLHVERTDAERSGWRATRARIS